MKMSRKRANDAAIHLWEQIFSGLAKRDDATLSDPDYDYAEGEARARIAFQSAGWSKGEIQSRLEADKKLLSSAPITSPGVNLFSELFLEKSADDIESAMERLNMHSHARVARGIEPVVGPEQQQPR
jgi:hypothetical protein